MPHWRTSLAVGVLGFWTAWVPAAGQTATYHLHKEQSAINSSFDKLLSGSPDASSSNITTSLTNKTAGEYVIKQFETQSGVPNSAGVIPAGSSLSFGLWMRKTSNVGTVFARAKVGINSASGPVLCTGTATTALTTTVSKQNFTCTTAGSVSMSATYRFYLWVGVNLTGTSSSSFNGELDIEGSANGNFDSQITVPLPNTTPVISSVSPNSGAVRSVVLIDGSNFGNGQGGTVSFNGVPGTPSVWSDSSITVPVPAGATSGPLVVTVGGLASAGVTFTVTPPPSISNLTPTSGRAGASITITGNSFGPARGNGSVTFNGVWATISSWSDASIVASVPLNSSTGNVVVTAAGGVQSNGAAFTVIPPPGITSVSPNTGAPGSTVLISGSSFGASQGTGSVTFNGAPATITNWSDSAISALVPAGATSGTLVVTADGGGSGGAYFAVVNPTGVSVDRIVTGHDAGFGQITTDPLTTNAAPELLLAFVSGGANGSTVPAVSSVTGGGVTWVLVGRSNQQGGTAEIWSAFASSPVLNAPITAMLNGPSQGMMTVVSFMGVDQTGSNGVGAIGAVAFASGASGFPSASLTTTRSNSLVFGVGASSVPVVLGSASAQTAGPNQVLIMQDLDQGCIDGINCISSFSSALWTQQLDTAVQVAGTTLDLNDTSFSSERWDLIAVEVLPAATATTSPMLTSLSANIGSPGTSITIRGSNFGATQGASTVTFNGAITAPVTWSPGTIVVPVPNGSSSGNVVVTVGGQNSNGLRFLVANPAGLAIDQVATTAGSELSLFPTTAGNELLLALVSFGPNTFGPIPTAQVQSSPGNLVWELVQRTNTQQGTAEIWRAFSPMMLTNLQISDGAFFNDSAITVVGILGADGSEANGAAAVGAVGSGNASTGPPSASLVTTRANSLIFGVGDDPAAGVARVPGTGQSIIGQEVVNQSETLWAQQVTNSAAGSGSPVTLNDTAPAADPYNLSIVEVRGSPNQTPTIAALSPDSGGAGTPVTISGSNFGAVQGSSSVTFAGIVATPTTWTSTSIVVPVPATVPLGPADVVVTVPGAGSSNSATFTVVSPLTISASKAPSPNTALWNNTDVTITYTCSGGVAPVQCPAPQTVATEGIQTIHATATDASGASIGLDVPLKIDKTLPLITASVTPGADSHGVVTAPATISFICSDATSGVAACPAPIQVTSAGANQVFSGTSTDIAGNAASASLTLSIETAPLGVTASAAPAPNMAGWNNTSVTVSFQCSGGVPPVQCPPPQTLSSDGANQIVPGSATDAAGVTATASLPINLDRAPPLVSITSPADGLVSTSASVNVTGLVSDGLSGLASVSCNGSAGTISGGNFNCSLQITQGALVILVTATDLAGNSASTSLTTSVQGPKVLITSPTPLTLFNSKSITVTGTIDDPAATITVNGVVASNEGGTFSASGVVLREGSSVVTATATNSAGAVGTASVDVVLDSTPPIVTIDSPSDGAVVTSPQVYVTGMVNDLVPGTVNTAQVSVNINGVPAAVTNRSFMAEDVLLVPGQNLITAVATDRAGNTSQSSITITLLDAATQQHLIAISGNGQTGSIGSTLPQPLVVQAINSFGQPVPNVPITFAMNKSDGQLTAFPQQGRQITVLSDANGQASATLQLGTRAGSGNNQVLVTSPGFVGQIMFCSTSTAGSAAEIHDIAGEGQIGVIGQALPEPFVVVVFDSGGNPVAGVPVTFKVEQGGGTIDANSTATKITDSDGRASAVLVLAQEEGVNNNVVTASFDGFAGTSPAFVASGVTPLSPTNTTVSGIVLDNANHPLVNVTASIQGTTLSAVTNADGRFTIANAPVGSIELFIDGSTSTDPEPYPFLEFPLVTVAGQDNHLSGPIFLPEIDSDNSKLVGGDEDVTLTMNGVPGVVFTVFAHSATFPDGTKVGKLSVSQVHADKVPMQPPNGTAPALFWTVQPPRVKFDPPMRVQIPNTNGLPPGTVTEIFCYNHDLEEFASSGTARVSEDGSVIISDPGSGVIVSGWGDAPPPAPPQGPVCNCSDPSPCISAQCVNGTCVKQSNVPAGQVCHKVEITAQIKDHDQEDPDYQASSATNLYGGSSDKTSDFLKLKAEVDPDVQATSFVWTVSGDASAPYTPVNTQEWEVGQIQTTTGALNVHVEVTFSDGQTGSADKQFEVGLRTDDIEVVGWINEAGVSLNIPGVRSDVLAFFDPNGPDQMSILQKGLSAGYLGIIAAGLPITPTIYEEAIAAAIPTLVTPPVVFDAAALEALELQLQNLFGTQIFLNPDEKTYILNWQFRFAGNDCNVGLCPPASFANNEAVLDNLNNHRDSYKLFNRLQIKFRVDAGNFKGGSPDAVLHRAAGIGVTHDPLFGLPVPGASGVINDNYAVKNANTAHHVNEGSPSAIAVSGFNTLASPLKWNDIGSRIVEGASQKTGKQIFVQVYPTYNLYSNGAQNDPQIPQAPEPIQNFTTSPFYGTSPSGTAPFVIPQ